MKTILRAGRPSRADGAWRSGDPERRRRRRRGAALLLSLLILIVLVAIVLQINLSTSTDARIARNDVGLASMDLAIESALLQVQDQLKTDAESDSASSSTPAPGGAGGAGGMGAPTTGAAGAAGAGGGPGGQQAPVDSRRDDWARPARTEINEIRLRILVQDEDSKINVLSLLNPDPKEAQAAFDRVVRCLELCRAGTDFEIDGGTADRMARAMLDHMKSRRLSKLPRPTLLTDDPSNTDLGLPLSLREFAVLAPFDESHFREFRDSNGRIVHSIGSFLTVWSSVATASDLPTIQQDLAKAATLAAAPPPSSGSSNGSGGKGGTSGTPSSSQTSGSTTAPTASAGGSHVDTGGFAVNVNTAPVAVLKALFDDHDLHPRFWDRVVEYRNLEEEKPKDAPVSDAPAALDEYGNQIIERRIFEALTELKDVDGYTDLPPEVQLKLGQMLTTQSRVFSIFVVARRSTSSEADMDAALGTPEEVRLREEQGDSLVRVVRCVVWRRKLQDKVEIVPLVRWEVLDYAPYEVQDYPDEKR